MSSTLRPFHLAFPIKNIQKTKKWYTEILDCTVGRQSDKWIDFNFHGHQIVGHLVNDITYVQANEVDKKNIPSRHFGIILTPEKWFKLAKQLESKKIKFHIKPHTRFKNKAGEQHTMFIKDPDNNFLEFKAFEDDENIFKKNI